MDGMDDVIGQARLDGGQSPLCVGDGLCHAADLRQVRLLRRGRRAAACRARRTSADGSHPDERFKRRDETIHAMRMLEALPPCVPALERDHAPGQHAGQRHSSHSTSPCRLQAYDRRWKPPHHPEEPGCQDAVEELSVRFLFCFMSFRHAVLPE